MYKIILALLLAMMAACGTLIYGYNFAKYYLHNTNFEIPFGIFLAIVGAGANIVLGTFSLLKIHTGPVKYPLSIFILIISVFSTIPIGCICFFGYQSVIPIQINIAMSFIVVIVNIAINYTAVQYFIKDVITIDRKNKIISNPTKNTIIIVLGYLIGSIVALAPFLATTAGANDILLHYKLDNLYKYNVAIIIGILSVLPLACLYSHTTNAILGHLLKFFQKAFKGGVKINSYHIAIFIFCLFSGAALAETMREFILPDKNIPILFKTEFMKLISYILIFLAWFVSTSTTFYCLNDLLKNRFSNK